MTKRSKNQKSSYLQMLIILLGIFIAVTLFVFNYQQKTRTNANPATTLSFSPTTSSKSPLALTLSKPQSVNIVINPGTNQVSYAKLEILYDATKFSITTGSMTALIPTFTILESSYTPGRILVAFSIGSDTANIISLPTTIASLQLNPIGKTSKLPTQISFGSNTLILSVAPTDSSYENVLSASTPLYAKIAALNGRK